MRYMRKRVQLITARKVSVIEVFLVCIFPDSDTFHAVNVYICLMSV